MQATSPSDTPQQVDINPQMALERLDTWVDGFVRSLPNIAMAIVVIAAFIGMGVLAQRLIQSSTDRQGRANLGEMLGSLAKWVLIVAGVLMGATIVMPSLNPGDLIAGLGVSSVAIGFAFKDILQNWLAGLLILLRQPFEIGDQIAVGDYEGTVMHIETRATLVRTYDGQRAVIPNSEIYTNAVLVKTGLEKRRSQYDIGIGYADDMDEACDIILRELKGIEGIEQDPEPQAFPWDLAASWVTIRARWWTDSKRGDVVQNRANVIRRVKKALDEAGIDMPYDTRVQLMHDQTEARDGDRSRQREGWPEERDERVQPRWRAQEQDGSSQDSAEAK